MADWVEGSSCAQSPILEPKKMSVQDQMVALTVEEVAVVLVEPDEREWPTCSQCRGLSQLCWLGLETWLGGIAHGCTWIVRQP